MLEGTEMPELSFVAYILSLLSLWASVYLWCEVKDLKKERKRDLVNRRLEAIRKETPPPKRPKGIWD